MAEDDDVEETTPLKAALFESLRQCLVGEGFKLNAMRDNFFRQRGGFTDIFQITCLDAQPGYRVQPGVAVRVERVEDIFHMTSGIERKYQKDSPTMGTRVGSLLSGSPRDCEFLLESKSAIASVTEKIVCVFRDVALPYFKQWGSLAAIDAELNDKPGERSVHWALAWYRCSAGIIVAKLVGRPDYDQLAAIYLDVMTRDNKGFYLKWFKPLLKSLESVETGSGLVPKH